MHECEAGIAPGVPVREPDLVGNPLTSRQKFVRESEPALAKLS